MISKPSETFFRLDTGGEEPIDVYLNSGDDEDSLQIGLHDDAMHCVIACVKIESLRKFGEALSKL